MEEHHLQVWSPTRHNIRQWKAIRQSQVSKILPRLRSQEPLLFSKTPSSQQSDKTEEQKPTQNYQNSFCGGKRGHGLKNYQMPFGQIE